MVMNFQARSSGLFYYILPDHVFYDYNYPINRLLARNGKLFEQGTHLLNFETRSICLTRSKSSLCYVYNLFSDESWIHVFDYKVIINCIGSACLTFDGKDVVDFCENCPTGRMVCVLIYI